MTGNPVPKLPTMMMPLFVKFWAKKACFSRPEFATERMTYLVPPPSAVRGMLEAIYWKPEFHWRVREIRVLKPIEFFSEVRNTVSTKANRGSVDKPYVTDDSRLQQHTCGLHDVAYVVVAETIPVPFTVEDLEKHVHIFKDRVQRGQCWHQPWMGVREYSAYFGPADGTETPIDVSMTLGRMSFDQNYGADDMQAVWFDAELKKGVVHVPDALYEVSGGCRGNDREQPPRPQVHVA